MALASPCGILSDEEECGAVFESTAADIGALMRSQRFVSPLPEISVITPAADPQTPTQEVLPAHFHGKLLKEGQFVAKSC